MPSIIDVQEAGRTFSRPIDDLAKAIFLAELRATGLYTSAAMKARQHLANKGSAYSAFKQLEARDPDFKAQVEDALAEAAAAAERELVDRAFNGKTEKVKYATHPETGERLTTKRVVDGKVVEEPVIIEETTKFDNALLLMVARNALRRLDKDAYSPPTAKKEVSVSGGTTNVVANIDLDQMLEAAPREFREFIVEFAAKQKQLASGGQKELIDVRTDDVPPPRRDG